VERKQEKVDLNGDKEPVQDLVVTTFRDVDKTQGDGFAACMHCLEYIRDLPQFQSVRDEGIKELSLNASPLRVLELGSGLGYEVASFAKTLSQVGGDSSGSEVLGIEKSVRFVEEATARWADSTTTVPFRFITGDLTQLSTSPIADEVLQLGSMHRIWEERVLQHIQRDLLPAVLEQVASIIAPGGIFVAVEPVWSKFWVQATDQETSDLYTGFWEKGFNHPEIAASLLKGLPAAGFQSVAQREIEISFSTIEEVDRVFQLRASLEKLVAAERTTGERVSAWLNDQGTREKHGDFRATLTMSITKGLKS